ncbi:hypothetical protein FQA39_LY12874 [Lamprigera yunnana]|nr:hypothetical protein FQA39_LY12874 [Lamprigera yunnana]
MIFDTKHAIYFDVKGIKALMHIGLDTVKLNGSPFKIKTEQEKTVNLKSDIVSVDLKTIKDAGLSTETPIVLKQIVLRKLNQMGAVIGVSLVTKNFTFKRVAVSSIMGGFFGVSEPMIYGVTLPKFRPFIIGCLVAFPIGILSGVLAMVKQKFYKPLLIDEQTNLIKILNFDKFKNNSKEEMIYNSILKFEEDKAITLPFIDAVLEVIDYLSIIVIYIAITKGHINDNLFYNLDSNDIDTIFNLLESLCNDKIIIIKKDKQTHKHHMKLKYPLSLSVQFVDSITAQQINIKERNESYIPDVLSFPIEMNEKEIEMMGVNEIGDLIICFGEANNKSVRLEHSIDEEMAFLFIHDNKVSIVTNKAQTTRNNIKGILNTTDSQIIFVDTPGIHTTKKELDRFMNASAFNSTKDVDVLLFLLPADEFIGQNDSFYFKSN